MASKSYLLDHLFAQVKARVENSKPTTDLERADFIASSRMPVQQVAARDPSRKKAVRCPRRAGKSWFVLSVALEECLRNPGSVWVIVGLSRPSITQIFWSLIKQLNKDLELGINFKEIELSATFLNGSVILFRGADSRSEIEKLRGGKYDGVIIDECKSFNPIIFTELVQDVIEPALGDRNGVIILVGTPGDVLAGPFYEATCEQPIVFRGADGVDRASNHRYGVPVDLQYIWSFHTWTLQDNVEVPHLWTLALATKAQRGWSDDHPTWRREYLGHWVASTNRLVYRFVPSLHEYNGELPLDHKWRFVLALDVGYHDADAIVVWAYASTSFDVYVVHAQKRAKLNITQLAGWIHEVRATYCDNRPEVMTGDFGGLATKVFEELAAIHGLPFEPAEKKEKNDFIEILNTEYDAGRIHILAYPDQPQTDDMGKPLTLSAELLTNRWLEKTLGTPKRKEDPATPNDLCDAHLYGWRWCDHRRAQPPDRRPTTGTTEWWLERQRLEFEAAVAQHLRSRNDDRLDHDWWTGAQDTTYDTTGL